MPWVSKELCALRTRARVAYKAWTRVGDAEHGSRFRLAKATYRRELRRAKEKPYSKFKLTSSSTDTFAGFLESFSGLQSKNILRKKEGISMRLSRRLLVKHGNGIGRKQS
jgi:hypothetical protein